MKAAGLMSEAEASLEASKAFAQMKDATTPKRILGFGPKTRGRHLFNLFGIIATDSWVDESKVAAKMVEKEGL